MPNLHRDTNRIRREPRRDGKILTNHRQDVDEVQECRTCIAIQIVLGENRGEMGRS